MRLKLLFLVLGLGILLPVHATSRSARLSVDSGLYSEPDTASQLITTLPEGSDVSIEQRYGSWYQVLSQSDGNQGWVRSYDLQLNTRGGNWLTRLKRVLSGPAPDETTNVATIGIRGLGPGDVKNAAPDQNELRKLDDYRVGIDQGLQYAANLPLKSNEVAYLDVHETENTGSSNPVKGAAEGLGTVIEGVGNSLGGAVKGLGSLFGGGKDEK